MNVDIFLRRFTSVGIKYLPRLGSGHCAKINSKSVVCKSELHINSSGPYKYVRPQVMRKYTLRIIVTATLFKTYQATEIITQQTANRHVCFPSCLPTNVNLLISEMNGEYTAFDKDVMKTVQFLREHEIIVSSIFTMI